MTAGYARNRTPLGGSFLFTVDVESDWGTGATAGIREALPRLLETLDRHGAAATFFVVGELVEEVRAVLDPASRHEVGSHGLTHRALTRLSADEVVHEVGASRAALQAAGYRVAGFRAPFLRAPRGLAGELARAGYSYDSSLGSVVPSPKNIRFGRGPIAAGAVPRLRPGTLRDRLTPFSLTWLRVLHPWGVRLGLPGAELFYCHLHELLDVGDGWRGLPGPLRRLHARNCGAPAWGIVESLLEVHRGRTTTCRAYVEARR